MVAYSSTVPVEDVGDMMMLMFDDVYDGALDPKWTNLHESGVYRFLLDLYRDLWTSRCTNEGWEQSSGHKESQQLPIIRFYVVRHQKVPPKLSEFGGDTSHTLSM
jgi:hypothetical protein